MDRRGASDTIRVSAIDEIESNGIEPRSFHPLSAEPSNVDRILAQNGDANLSDSMIRIWHE